MKDEYFRNTCCISYQQAREKFISLYSERVTAQSHQVSTEVLVMRLDLCDFMLSTLPLFLTRQLEIKCPAWNVSIIITDVIFCEHLLCWYCDFFDYFRNGYYSQVFAMAEVSTQGLLSLYDIDFCIKYLLLFQKCSLLLLLCRATTTWTSVG